MAFAKITTEGLRWIAVLVIVLWGCILLEDSMVKHAKRETAQVLFQLQKMRDGRLVIPVSHPVKAVSLYSPQAG